MRKAILSALLLVACVVIWAQNRNVCRLGITYEVSQNVHWGKGKPVVTGIIPYSPAELAGIKVNDIILTIDGVQTMDISPDEITELLNPAGKNELLLTVANLSAPSKQILIKKECKRSNAITEEQLAVAFCMYSLETTSEREFVCPFKTTTTTDPVDFLQYKTFAF